MTQEQVELAVKLSKLVHSGMTLTTAWYKENSQMFQSFTEFRRLKTIARAMENPVVLKDKCQLQRVMTIAKEETLYNAVQEVGRLIKSLDGSTQTLEDICRQLKGETPTSGITPTQSIEMFNSAVDNLISITEVSEMLSLDSFTLDKEIINRLMQFLETVNNKNTYDIFGGK